MMYAYDLWAQMPVKDLFDTLMMLADIQAAKDMYEKGLELIKEFRKEYGDFLTGITSLQDWYNNEFDVNGFLNSLYEQGMDPVRSAEGRAAMARWAASRNYGKLAKIRKNAAIYDAYKKAEQEAISKGEFSEELERFRMNGRRPEDWGENEEFTFSAPIKYQDLNQFTGHIFDKMDDSFIGTDDNGMDWTGVTREMRKKALTEHLAGLRATTLGEFHYQQSKKQLEKELGREATEEEAMNKWSEDILTATTEYEHQTQKENPNHTRWQDVAAWKWLDDQKTENAINKYRNKKEIDAEFEGDDKDSKKYYDSDELMYESGLANMLGLSQATVASLKLNNMTVQEWADSLPGLFESYANILKDNTRTNVQKFTHQTNLPEDFVANMQGGQTVDRANNKDVSGRGMKYLPEDRDEFMSESHLETLIKVGTNLMSYLLPIADEDFKKRLEGNGNSAEQAVMYNTKTSNRAGIVTAVVDRKIMSFAPVNFYDSNGLFVCSGYKVLPRRSYRTNANPAETGLLTSWDDKTQFASLIGSLNLNKAQGVGGTGLTSVAIPEQ